MDLRICEICGIRYPIFLGPMMHVSTAPLVAAFSEAGGLGCLGVAGMKEEQFHKEVAQIRCQTDLAFAINIAWTTPNPERQLKCCIEENIGIVISSAGSPEEGTRRLKDAGAKVFQVVSNVAQAIRAEALEIDGVITKGFESGGVNTLNGVASLPLIPQVVDAVSIPVIAAGGIGDGRGMAAALVLGADGVLIGTRFLASQECLIHDNYKKALIDAKDTDTVPLNLPGFSVRVWKNKRAEQLRNKLVYVDQLWRMMTNLSLGDYVEQGLMGCGQIAGLIKTCPSVREIIEEIINDFNMAVRRIQTVSEDLSFNK